MSKRKGKKSENRGVEESKEVRFDEFGSKVVRLEGCSKVRFE